MIFSLIHEPILNFDLALSHLTFCWFLHNCRVLTCLWHIFPRHQQITYMGRSQAWQECFIMLRVIFERDLEISVEFRMCFCVCKSVFTSHDLCRYLGHGVLIIESSSSPQIFRIVSNGCWLPIPRLLCEMPIRIAVRMSLITAYRNTRSLSPKKVTLYSLYYWVKKDKRLASLEIHSKFELQLCIHLRWLISLWN